MYKIYQLENGIRIILERIPHFRSASIGLWFTAGSAYEKQPENGLSHFIEHMLFKGTEHRSAKQIAEVMDSVGGQLNAFTAKEYTCFYCKVMDEHIDLGLDLLSDMLLHSVFDENELTKEKGVILEEINMYDDSPEDLVHELLSKAFFGQHPLAMPILGTPELLEEYTRKDLLNIMEKYYTADNLVISAAGNFDEDGLVDNIKRYFGSWQKKGSTPLQEKAEDTGTEILFSRKEIEQVHLSLAFPGTETGSDDIYPMLILNNLFGGGMSSRLFQKIREDRGLTYSVFSYPSNYLAGGMFSIYAGMKPSQSGEVLKLILEEAGLLKNNGITEAEFHMAREQLKGNYILGMESTNSRMNSIGKSKLLLEKVMTQEEVIDKINSITPQDVHRVIRDIFQSGKIAAAAVGSEDFTEQIRETIQGGI
jgi:predicted Zn-dependent peptidase